MYTDRRWRNPAKHRHVGYSAVGPGWRDILSELDHQFVMLTGMGTSNHAKIQVLQIKEKFGNLRVYVDYDESLDEETCKKLDEAIARAEQASTYTCEACGSTEGTENRIRKGSQYGWTKTFCQRCHALRDEKNVFPNPDEDEE